MVILTALIRSSAIVCQEIGARNRCESRFSPAQTLLPDADVGSAMLDEVGEEIVDLARQVARGAATKSETLGHREFVLTYKTFEPSGPGCFPHIA